MDGISWAFARSIRGRFSISIGKGAGRFPLLGEGGISHFRRVSCWRWFFLEANASYVKPGSTFTASSHSLIKSTFLPCREPDAFSLAHNFALHAPFDIHTILLLLFNSGFVLVMFIKEMIKSTYGDLESVRFMKCSFVEIAICLREAVIVLYDSNAILYDFTICIRWYD